MNRGPVEVAAFGRFGAGARNLVWWNDAGGAGRLWQSSAALAPALGIWRAEPVGVKMGGRGSLQRVWRRCWRNGVEEWAGCGWVGVAASGTSGAAAKWCIRHVSCGSRVGCLRHNRGMIATTLPLAPERWATLPAPDSALLEHVATLRLENVALRAQITALQAAGEPGPQSRGAVPGADEMVAGPVDLCTGGKRGADQQWVGARSAAGGVVAQGQLRVGQPGRRPLCGAATGGGSILPPARTAAARFPGCGGRASTPGKRVANVAP
jgi:hypothetical protein